MEVNGQLQTHPLFLRRKSPWYLLERRLGGLRSQYGHCSDDKNLVSLLGTE
jgi:hypothetical protein